MRREESEQLQEHSLKNITFVLEEQSYAQSDQEQFLMSYEATIASFRENTATLANSFIMASRGVTQTWYSSLCPGSINRWQQLKRQLLTRFLGFSDPYC